MEKFNINGWLVIDKPYGMSSSQVVSRLKRMYHPKKIGHTGTLDPLATGVLPIAFGHATRLIPYMIDGDKGYEFDVTWGKQTETDDAEGKVLFSSDKRPSLEEIHNILQMFNGEVYQVPPKYSALKIDGKRAYHKAREGDDFELSSRKITIKELKVIEHSEEKTKFQVVCSKGTYIRSIGRDMGKVLGCFGYISFLRRIRNGVFIEKDQKTLENIEELEYNERVASILPLETVLDDILVLAVSDEDAERLCCGQKIKFFSHENGKIVLLKNHNNIIGLGFIEHNVLAPKRIFIDK